MPMLPNQTRQAIANLPTDMSADEAAAALAHATYIQQAIFGQQNTTQPSQPTPQPAPVSLATGHQTPETVSQTTETPPPQTDTTAEIDALKTQFQDEIKTLKKEMKDDIKTEMDGIRKQIKDALAS